MGEAEQVADVLRARLGARARARVQEPMHARPPVTGLPDDIRNEQRACDPHSKQEAVCANEVAPPNEETAGE